MKITAKEFIERFQQLLLEKPRYNLKQVQVENSDFADTAVKSRNCYFTFGAFYSEDLLYSRYSRKCISSADLTFCVQCELCIECIDCAECFDLYYCEDCANCSGCSYCTDCYSCSDCFGCYGLHRKQFCLFNEQLSRAEYEARVAVLDLSLPSTRVEIQAQTEKLKRTLPRLAQHFHRVDNCSGNHLTECSDCIDCYDSFALEECLYCVETNGNRSCADLTVCFENELCYSSVHSPLNYNCNFLYHTDQSSDSEFCAYSKSLKSCFGCVYLANKEYHLLNIPLSPAEYRATVAELKQELIRMGQYDLSLYLVSEYDRSRFNTEPDPALISSAPLIR